MLFLSSMFALTIWAVVGSLVALRTDGLGDGALARRNQIGRAHV